MIVNQNRTTENDHIVWDLGDVPTQQFADEQMGQTRGKIYIIVDAGMGCNWYIRRTNVGSPIETFFMHSDNWGQYGPATSHIDQLANFIRDYRHLELYP